MFMVRPQAHRRLTELLIGQWVHRPLHIDSTNLVDIYSTRLGQHNVYTVSQYGVVRTLNRRTQVIVQSRNGIKSGRYAFDTDALCHGSPGMYMSILSTTI